MSMFRRLGQAASRALSDLKSVFTGTGPAAEPAPRPRRIPPKPKRDPRFNWHTLREPARRLDLRIYLKHRCRTCAKCKTRLIAAFAKRELRNAIRLLRGDYVPTPAPREPGLRDLSGLPVLSARQVLEMYGKAELAK